MFGESESESPRVPSPWDPFISSSPSSFSLDSSLPKSQQIPKLAPEAEDGNVEYKQQLLSPSPARFARLVTQLKWRLLEGGGQAYYEIGVADSGALIGLPRVQLEQSLQTLEEMAGEIGASVIIVKEIELTGKDIDGGFGTGSQGRRSRRRNKATLTIGYMSCDDSTGTTTTESELSTTDLTDLEPEDNLEMTVPDEVPSDCDLEYAGHRVRLPTNKISLPNFQIDDDGSAVFSMDPEPDISDIGVDADVETEYESRIASKFAVDLEIASVYKPRPIRRRTHMHAHFDVVSGRNVKKVPGQAKGKTVLPASTDPLKHVQPLDRSPEHLNEVKELKATKRQATRDRKKQEKRRSLMGDGYFSGTPLSTVEGKLGHSDARIAKSSDVDVKPHATAAILDVVDHRADDVLPAFGSLRVVSEQSAMVYEGYHEAAVRVHDADRRAQFQESGELDERGPAVHPLHDDATLPDHKPETEIRLIVEVLVVRKLSLEEAFLDFGGFSLIP